MGKTVMQRIYAAWAWIILAAVVVQVFLAGLYVFGISSIEAHAINGTFVLFATLLGGIVALVARVPGRVAGWSWGLFGLVILQVLLIEVGNSAGVPLIKAFHVVNAFAVFALAGVLARQASAYFAGAPGSEARPAATPHPAVR